MHACMHACMHAFLPTLPPSVQAWLSTQSYIDLTCPNVEIFQSWTSCIVLNFLFQPVTRRHKSCCCLARVGKQLHALVTHDGVLHLNKSAGHMSVPSLALCPPNTHSGHDPNQLQAQLKSPGRSNYSINHHHAGSEYNPQN